MSFINSMLMRRRAKKARKQHVMSETERPLSGEERALLEFVLTHTTVEALQFMGQLDETSVIASCSGCPDVALRGPDSRDELRSGSGPLVELLGKTVDGRLVQLFVYATRRQLSGFEVCNLSESEDPWGLPVLDSLKDYEGNQLKPRYVSA